MPQEQTDRQAERQKETDGRTHTDRLSVSHVLGAYAVHPVNNNPLMIVYRTNLLGQEYYERASAHWKSVAEEQGRGSVGGRRGESR